MKKYEDKTLHIMLHFKCTSSACNFEMEEMNGWFDEVPKICPECKEGKIEEFHGGCTNFVNTARQRNWKQGLSQSQIVDCLADPKKNPY